MLAQMLRQKPAGDREIFVMGAGKALAIQLRFGERGRMLGDGVGGRQGRPSPAQIFRERSRVGIGSHGHPGMIAVLISLLRSAIPLSTFTSSLSGASPVT